MAWDTSSNAGQTPIDDRQTAVPHTAVLLLSWRHTQQHVVVQRRSCARSKPSAAVKQLQEGTGKRGRKVLTVEDGGDQVDQDVVDRAQVHNLVQGRAIKGETES